MSVRVGSFLPFLRCCAATPVASLFVLCAHGYVVKYSQKVLQRCWTVFCSSVVVSRVDHG